MQAPDAGEPGLPPHPDAGGLRSCPFCGGAPVWERGSVMAEAVRIVCHADECPIRPATEYLLHEHAAMLRDAWNRRA